VISDFTSGTNYPFPLNAKYYTVPVTLQLKPAPGSSHTALSAVLDAASYLTGKVSPGEILTIFGNQIGPASPVTAQPDLYGKFPSTLGGAAVSFDGLPAPMIYASSSQLIAVAPFGIVGKNTSQISVHYGNNTSDSYTAPVAATAPAIFTADASGSGLAAALNVAPDGTVSLNSHRH
jgi:uncharacterized protein (TIGR03437 family)